MFVTMIISTCWLPYVGWAWSLLLLLLMSETWWAACAWEGVGSVGGDSNGGDEGRGEAWQVKPLGRVFEHCCRKLKRGGAP